MAYANHASNAKKKRNENPHQLPTPRRSALASTRQKIQGIRATRQPEEKNAGCMAPGTLQNSEKYPKNTTPSKPHGGHITKKKPAPAAIKNVVRPSSFTVQQKRRTTWYPMMYPYQGKIRKKAGKKT